MEYLTLFYFHLTGQNNRVQRSVQSASAETQDETRNSADADKPCDVFRGQSRSPNMVPFDMLGMVSY